jgi:hypothetical protein
MFTALIAASLLMIEAPSREETSRPVLSTLDGAAVVRVSRRPTVMSGVFAVWVDFDVRVDGGMQTLYMAYLRADQFIPPVNSVCRIVFERAPLDGISSDGALDGRTPHNRVEELDCDTGR